MARTANLTLNLDITGFLELVLDASTDKVSPNIKDAITYANGTGDGQIDRLWADDLTINPLTQGQFSLEDFSGVDIGQGTGRDMLGQLAGFAEVSAIFIKNNSTDTLLVLNVAGGAYFQGPMDASGDTLEVLGGGFLFVADPAGWPVVNPAVQFAYTPIAGAANPIDFTLVIAGRSV